MSPRCSSSVLLVLFTACAPGTDEPTPRPALPPEAAAPLPGAEGAAALSRGAQQLRQGDVLGAVDSLRRARRLRTDDPIAAFYLGRALHSDTKLAEAEKAYSAAIALQPDLGEAYVHLSSIQIEQGRLDEALATLEGLGRARGEGPALVYQKGFVLSKLGRFDEADALLRTSVRASPAVPDTWYALGVNEQRRGRDREAARAFRKVLELDGDYADAWFNLGNALARLGETAAAESALQRFAAVNIAREAERARESTLQVLQKGAEMALAEGRLDDVEPELARAEEVQGGLAWVERLRGELFLARGEGSGALEHLRRAAALQGNDASEELALGEAFRRAGDEEAARRHESRAQALLATLQQGGSP